jgi:hypothetical protein
MCYFCYRWIAPATLNLQGVGRRLRLGEKLQTLQGEAMNFAYRPLLMLGALGMAFSMATPARTQSLADLARQTRTKKQEEPKTGKVFTNDSIPVATISSAPAETPSAEAAPTGEKAQPGEEAKAGQGAAAESEAKPKEPTQEDLEKEYRAKFAELRKNLDTEQRRLDVMQRELNLAQMQFYSNPDVALREQYSREEIKKRTADIETEKATVAKAQQAISDLEDELRQKGLPPGWAR